MYDTLVGRTALLLVLLIPACSSEPSGPNPTRLWLAGIGGSESNLQLVESGPPDPF